MGGDVDPPPVYYPGSRYASQEIAGLRAVPDEKPNRGGPLGQRGGGPTDVDRNPGGNDQAPAPRPGGRAVTGNYYPAKYPSKQFTEWRQFESHFLGAVEINRWTDREARQFLQCSLTGAALDDYLQIPPEIREETLGHPVPQLHIILEHLRATLGPALTEGLARAKLKGAVQQDGESLLDFSRRLRRLGMHANTRLGPGAVDQGNKEAFVDGIQNQRVRELLLQEDLPTFQQNVTRAQNLEAIEEGEKLKRNRIPQSVKLATTTDVVCTAVAVPAPSQTIVTNEATVANSINRFNDGMSRVLNELNGTLRQQEVAYSDLTVGVKNLDLGLRELRSEVRGMTDQSRGRSPSAQRYGANYRSPRPPGDRGHVECYECGQKGHYRYECPLAPQNQPNGQTSSQSFSGGAGGAAPSAAPRLTQTAGVLRYPPAPDGRGIGNGGTGGAGHDVRFVRGSSELQRNATAVLGQIQGSTTSLMIDTGSSVNLITKEGLRTLAPNEVTTVYRYDGDLREASGADVPVKGAVQLRVAVGDFVTVEEFLVIEACTVPVLLGTEYFDKHKSAVDFHTRKFYACGTESTVIPLVEESSTGPKGPCEVCGDDKSENAMTTPDEHTCMLSQSKGRKSVVDRRPQQNKYAEYCQKGEYREGFLGTRAPVTQGQDTPLPSDGKVDSDSTPRSRLDRVVATDPPVDAVDSADPFLVLYRQQQQTVPPPLPPQNLLLLGLEIDQHETIPAPVEQNTRFISSPSDAVNVDLDDCVQTMYKEFLESATADDYFHQIRTQLGPAVRSS